MSFDFPVGIEEDIKRFAQSEHISTDEAAIKLMIAGLETIHKTDLVTDSQIEKLKSLDPSFGFLEDVPEEKIQRMEETILRMKSEGFGNHA